MVSGPRGTGSSPERGETLRGFSGAAAFRFAFICLFSLGNVSTVMFAFLCIMQE